MKVLGIHAGHDAAAALVVDGEVVADAAEERFQRLKHCGGVPFHAIGFCLERAGLGPTDLDHVAIVDGTDAVLPYLDPRRAGTTPRDLPVFSLAPNAEVVHVDHHLAHAASAWLTCGSAERTLVVTCDGVGDGASITLWRGEECALTPLASFGPEASLGWFYEMVTEALGWWSWDGSGKTMGLAPYGDARGIEGILDAFAPSFAQGEPDRLLPSVIERSAARYRGQEHVHFPMANEIHALVERHGRENVAAEAQRVLEEEALRLVLPWLAREGVDRIACAGGVFLNVKLNQRLWSSGRLRAQHVFPNAGDAGTALGAALYAHHQLAPAPPRALEHVYWGPEHDDAEIAETVEACGLRAIRLEDPSEEAARRLADGRILGWFQGRMESGPRALGARSILMSPLDPAAKDVLNARVKFREPFRPFCPSLTEESAVDYLERPRHEAFMTTSFDVTEAKRAKIPAVVHVDGTLRPQTVRRSANPRYWRLLDAFGRLTGEPVLINTSFNVRGEPIVNGPRDAIRCFYGGGMDDLVLGEWLVSKTPR